MRGWQKDLVVRVMLRSVLAVRVVISILLKKKINCRFSIQPRNLPQPNASRQVQCYLKLFCLVSELWCLPVHKYCGHLIVCSAAIWRTKLNQILTISNSLSDIRYKNKPASLCVLAIMFCCVRLWDHIMFDWVPLKKNPSDLQFVLIWVRQQLVGSR